MGDVMMGWDMNGGGNWARKAINFFMNRTLRDFTGQLLKEELNRFNHKHKINSGSISIRIVQGDCHPLLQQYWGIPQFYYEFKLIVPENDKAQSDRLPC